MLQWLAIQKEKFNNETPVKRIFKVFMVLLLITIWYEIPVTEHISLKNEDKIGAPMRFALVTDLHSCSYSKDQAYLVKMVDAENPDAVLLSGDIFDDKLDDDNTKAFISAITEKYKCYYVTGNHEFWSGRVNEMKYWLRDNGVIVLDGKCVTAEINGEW